jgi:hypothetical protein
MQNNSPNIITLAARIHLVALHHWCVRNGRGRVAAVLFDSRRPQIPQPQRLGYGER